jgi:hypothetical protein
VPPPRSLVQLYSGAHQDLLQPVHFTEGWAGPDGGHAEGADGRALHPHIPT